MVKNDTGQLYTIEGFAAGLIMVITAYLVVNATSIYTAGDTHINDMQLEVMGTDALTMMGTPVNITENVNDTSALQQIIETGDYASFRTHFLELVNSTEGGRTQDIQFNASYSCRFQSLNPLINNTIVSYQISNSRDLTGGEHPVRATKWVVVNNSSFCGTNNVDRAVLVEVLLWRD